MGAKPGERNIEKGYCQSRKLCSIKLSANCSTPLIGFPHHRNFWSFSAVLDFGFVVVVVALFS